MARKTLHCYVYHVGDCGYPVESGSYPGDWRIAEGSLSGRGNPPGPPIMVHFVPKAGSRITHSTYDRSSEKWVLVETLTF